MLSLTLPVPPSLNMAFLNVRKRGRVKAPHYREWCSVADQLLALSGNKPLTGSVGVSIKLPRIRGDIDNRVKPILDALSRSGLIDDDRKVEWLSVERDASAKPKDDVKISVWPIQTVEAA